jgi:hypothetical protein
MGNKSIRSPQKAPPAQEFSLAMRLAAMHSNLSQSARLVELRMFVNEDLGPEVLSEKGETYLTFEKELGVNPGGGRGYAILAVGGNRYPLRGEYAAIMRAMDDWVRTGQGHSPAIAWRAARAAEAVALPVDRSASTPATDVVPLPEERRRSSLTSVRAR